MAQKKVNQINIRVDDTMHAWLVAAAKDEGRSIANLVLQMLRKQMEQMVAKGERG